MAIQKLVITAADPIDFVKRLLEAGSKGATLKDGTFPRIKGVPFCVELEKEITGVDEIKISPGINAIPVPMNEKVYTRSEMESLDWDTFKSACKSKNIGGRNRGVMTTQYLKAVSEKE